MAQTIAGLLMFKLMLQLYPEGQARTVIRGLGSQDLGLRLTQALHKDQYGLLQRFVTTVELKYGVLQ